VLAEEVDKQKRAHPAPSISQVRAEVIRDTITAEHKLEVTLPVPGKQIKHITVAKYISERVENFNSTLYLKAVVQYCWEILMRFRAIEEDMADRGLSTHCFADANCKIIGRMIEAIAELRKHDTLELLRQKVAADDGFTLRTHFQ
jgi:hypothetical protein